MFSAIVMTGISMKCWCTMPMPSRIASADVRRVTAFPPIRISPSSGRSSPYSWFIRVLLPAPFSPSSAWISPRRRSRSMWSFATSAPNRLVMPRSSSARSALEPRVSDRVGHCPCYLTVFGILMPPALIFAMIALTLVLTEDGTLEA